MRKYFLIFLSAIILLFTACDNWMQDDNFYTEIEDAVKVANAPQISVYVRYALTRQGKTDPDGAAIFKVGIPHVVSATTETEYGFVRWAAFTTDFVATGDNQSKNKDLYFIDDDDYNERILPNEIPSPLVIFDDPKSPTTTVTINVTQNNIFLVPIVAMRPAVSLTIPSKGSSGVVRNIAVRINFTKPMDIESFKNEAGQFDKIMITQGTQSFTADGDIEINSEDITDYFEPPIFSKNKKMITLKFDQDHISEGYASQSSVNITVSKDVKDIYGFNMTDDDKITFSVGSNKDTLAPRITQLTAGRDASSFNLFQGVYKDAGTINNVGAGTKMTLEGAADAPVDNIDSDFFNPFVTIGQTPGNFIKGNVVLRVFAEDIAGSGEGQSQTGIETDVVMLGMRAYHMYNSDGSPSSFSYEEIDLEAGQVFKFKSSNYVPQTNLATSVQGAYKSIIEAINANIPGTDNDFATDKGCLLDFDLSDLPDGLIRIDVAAVDMVQNSGFTDGGAYSGEYGNAWSSLFVIKDTTAPDAAANSSHVSYDSSSASHITSDGWFNETTFNNFKIKGDVSSIADSGHPRLRSPHDSLKWIIKPTSDTSWINETGSGNPGWQPVTNDYASFPQPSGQGAITYTYALMDYLGNVSGSSTISAFKYDGTAPSVGNPYILADPGHVSSAVSDTVLANQTLYIPITEEISGLKSIELKVRFNNGADYATPLADPSLEISKSGLVLERGTHYTIDSNKTIVFATPSSIEGNVTIKGLKLSDSLAEGTYDINVIVKDAAAADGRHESSAAQSAVISIDSVASKITQIYVPDLKATQRFGGSTTEYWQGSQSTTDVYVTFTEKSSGAKVFDFTGSTVQLTGSSAIYKYDPSTGALTQVPATVNSPTNLEVNTANAAKDYFAGTGQIIAKITNVQLATEGTDSTIKLLIRDAARNESAEFSTISSNEGSLNLANPGLPVISSFKYDSGAPKASGLVLKDRQADKDTSNHFVQAEAEFTNESSVNANISLDLDKAISGILSLTISGDATFTSSTEIYADATYPDLPLADTYLSDASKIDTDGNYLKSGGTPVLFDISADGKTASFKTAGGGHLVLESAALAIKNLALTSGDGLKSVTIKPRTICGLEATGASDTITLDTIVPAWNGKGLYSRTHNNVDATTVYPHSVDPAYASTAYGVALGSYYGGATAGSGAMEDLYFYRASNISIGSDVTDTNFKTTRWIASSDNSYLDNACCYGNFSGVWTAIALDSAGNQSMPISYNLVEDDTFATAAECNALYDYTILYKPDGAFIHRNTTIDEYGHYNYVIKNDDYQIRVKLGGNAVETGEEAVAGGTPAYTSGSPYSRKDNTTKSSKIEKYYVSKTNSSPARGSSEWKDYTSGASNTFNGISTSVDSNGTIIINLPHESSDPIILHLLDGCGNSTSVLVRASSTDSYGIYWRVDNEVGVYGEIGEGLHLNGTSEIIEGEYGSQNDVMFYRGSVLLKTHHLTESCRFPTGAENDPSFPTYSADPSFTYTMKSRIIAWTGTGIPDRDYFGNNDGTTYKTGITPPPASSDWCFVKQANSGGYPIFYVQNNFPQYDQSGLAKPSRYKLYLILEDTVGNYEIRQIRLGSNGIVVSKDAPAPNSGEKEYWFFDNTPPAVTPAASMTYNKINTISGRNYYSNNSYVNYTVTDSGSGVYSDGVNSPDYSSFGNRTSVPVTYSLNGRDTDASGKLVISSTSIYDYAGNSYTSNIELNNGASTQWVRLENHPVLKSNAAVAVNKSTPSTPNLGLTGNTAASANTTTGGPGGQKLELTAKWGVTDITVRLYTTTAQSNMLGWVVSESPLNVSESDFYTATQVTSDVKWDSTNSCWTYDYSKELSSSVLWQSKADKYFYPVNKAGLIGQNPVLVHFKNNYPPTIVNATTNGFSYTSSAAVNASYLSSDAPATPYTIKAGTSGTSAINYTTSAAKVTFTTTYNPTVCRFISAGADGNFGTADDVVLSTTDIPLTGTGPEYTVDLPANVSGTKLGIQLSRGAEEDSGIYPLNGPAGNNLWTYDNDTPVVDFGSTPAIKSGSSAGAAAATFTGDTLEIKYIQNENAFIGWSLTNAADIAHYQWKRRSYSDSTGWSDWSSGWTDFDSSYAATSGLTFPAPENKTEYKFRLIDTAGNISNVPENTVKLQRDQWAPEAAGGLEYHLKAGTENVTTAGMDIPYNNAGTEDADTRVISYSKTSTNTSSYYIDRIWIKLSNVTDKRDNSGNVSTSGMERSGIQKYEVYKNGTPQTSNIPSVSDDYWEITGLESNTDNTVYTYELKVLDNLGQTKTLKTFRTNADGTAPDLALKTGAGLVQKAADASGSCAVDCDAKDVSGATDNGIYYLNTDYAIINLTKTATDIYKYQVSINGGAWTDITPVVDTTGATHTVKYIFATPETATSYQFRAIDGVGNDSTPTSVITIRKDAAAPSGADNNVGWAFYKNNGSTSIASTYYDITNDGTESKSITYNGKQMNKFELDLSAIAGASEISGIRRYWLTTDDGTPETSIGNAGFNTTTNKWKFAIADSGSTQVIYKIRAEDWAGNFTEYREFKLTPDVESPAISFASTDKVPGAAEIDISGTTVYFFNAESTNAVINLSSASTDIKEYKVIIDGTESTITTESGLSTSPLSYTFAANTLTSQKVFSFKVIDKVGNSTTTTDSVTLVQDAESPALASGVAALTLAVLKADGSDALRVSASDKIANYIRTDSADEVTSTITYNPDVVKTIAFNNLENELSEYNTPATASGFEKLYYKTADGELQPMGGTGFNEITLGSNWNDTYYIYAKDKAGNQSEVLKTLVLIADSTAEINSNYVTTDSSVNKIHSYTAVNASGVGIDTIPWARTKEIGEYSQANIFTSGTKIMYAKTDLPGIVQYMLVRRNNTGDYDATASGEWLDVSDGTADNSGSNFIFSLPDIKTSNTRLAFFFRDAVGNQSGPYYLGNKSDSGIQWWMTTAELTSDNITIPTPTYNSGAASGWSGSQDYTVTVHLPAGTVIHSVFLGPKPSGANTGVVLSTNLDLFTFSGYGTGTAYTAVKETDSNEGYLILPSSEGSETGEITIGVYPHSNITTWSEPVIKFNGANIDAEGVSKQIFTDPNAGGGGGGSPDPNVNGLGGKGRIFGRATVSTSGSSESEIQKDFAGSRVIQFFSDVFSANEEDTVAVNNSIEEKPVKAKVKKTSKTKKAKTVQTTKTVEAVETAQSSVPVEQTADVAEPASSEVELTSVVNEPASVVVSTDSTTDDATLKPADTENEEKSSSKNAVIVVMLVALSGAGGAWFAFKGRKK